MTEFRVDISIRKRAQAPMDWKEFKSEAYDSYEDFADAVKQMVLDNIYDYLEGLEDDADDE